MKQLEFRSFAFGFGTHQHKKRLPQHECVDDNDDNDNDNGDNDDNDAGTANYIRRKSSQSCRYFWNIDESIVILHFFCY